MSRSYQNSNDVTTQEISAGFAGFCGGAFIFTIYENVPLITFIFMIATIRFIIGAWFNYEDIPQTTDD